jgi:lysyl-tRNA synthetase class 1
LASQDKETIGRELQYIDQWLSKWAPEDVKFELLARVNPADFNQTEKDFLNNLGQKVASAPANADGEWFHKAIYELKESGNLTPEQVFKPLYRTLIGKEQGPRAGWFLSILPRDWLIQRLRLES